MRHLPLCTSQFSRGNTARSEYFSKIFVKTSLFWACWGTFTGERKRRNEHQRTESLFALIYSPVHVLRHWIIHLPHEMMYLLLSTFQTSHNIYLKLFFTENSQPKDVSKGLGTSKPTLPAFPSQLWALNVMWVSQFLFQRHVQGLQMLNMYVTHKNGLRLTPCTPTPVQK